MNVNRVVKIFLLVGFFFFAASLKADEARAAAELYLSPAAQSLTTGESFSVNIMVDTGGEAITTIDAELTYPTNLLTLSSVSKVNSFITNWQTEDTSTAGVIRYTGMKPTPGYTSPPDGLFLTLNFQADTEGTATVSFDEDICKVHKDDEYATDILGATTGGTYTISSSSSNGSSEDETGTTNGTNGDGSGSESGSGSGSNSDTNGTPATGISLPAVVATGWGIAIFLFGLLLVL